MQIPSRECLVAALNRTKLSYIVVLTVGIRLAAWLILQPEQFSDFLGYFAMASKWSELGVLNDPSFTAFLSAGYPLLLAPFFYMFGAHLGTGIALNLLLSAGTCAIVWEIGKMLSRHRTVAVLSAVFFALWLPGIWNSLFLAKENLTTFLLLLYVYSILKISRKENTKYHALIAGITWAYGLIAGTSSILVVLGFLIILFFLWREKTSISSIAGLLGIFSLAAVLTISPWFYVTHHYFGHPLLTTNSGFNLYIGNNPAANGWFVSVTDTPRAENWQEFVKTTTEPERSDILKAEAINYIISHPWQTAIISVKKLVYFWTPNLPSLSDWKKPSAVTLIRIGELVEYVLILFFGFSAFFKSPISRDNKIIFGTCIAAFWVLHGLVYVIFRYRDPIIPLLLTMAASQVTQWLGLADRPRGTSQAS